MSAAQSVLLPEALAATALDSRRSRSPLAGAISRTIRNPMGAFGLSVVLALALVALAAPALAPYDPFLQHPGHELAPLGGAFPWGTDELGRDILSRVIFGTRTSLLVGVISVGLGAAAGIATGLLAGYLGGWLDGLIMRFYDALLAFPGILAGVAVVTVLGPGTINVAIAIAIAVTPLFARLTRASVLAERERDYVLAEHCLGAGSARIMWRHVLPNCLPPLLVQLALTMGFAVLAEAGLSFLGLGTQPPIPSWGAMLNESRAYLRDAPWIAIWPGAALALLMLGLNFLADALREALDPRRVNG